MSYEEYGPFQVGQFKAPLTDSLGNSLLQDADPAIFTMLEFYAAVLDIHLGDRWEAETTALEMTETALVGMKVPYDPGPFLTHVAFKFPILALYCVRETYSEKTRHKPHLEAEWRLQLILPTLTPDRFLKLYPILRAASKVILDRTEQGYDPEYQDGLVVAPVAGLEEYAIREARFGGLQPRAGVGGQRQETNLFFPTVEFDIAAFEIKTKATQEGVFSQIEGVDASISVSDEDGEELVADISEDLS